MDALGYVHRLTCRHLLTIGPAVLTRPRPPPDTTCPTAPPRGAVFFGSRRRAPRRPRPTSDWQHRADSVHSCQPAPPDPVEGIGSSPAQRPGHGCHALRFRRLPCILLLALGLVGGAPRAARAILRPLDGGGNFHTYVEVMNTWRNQDRLDVVVMVEVCNGDLEFAREEGGLVARLRIEVGLVGPDGAAVSDTRQVRTPPLSAADAASRTQFQVFGLIWRTCLSGRAGSPAASST